MSATHQAMPGLGAAALPNEFEQLCDAIRLSQGDFALYLIRYRQPSVRDEVQKRLRSELEDLRIVTVTLQRSSPDAPATQTVLDTLCAVGRGGADKPPDALMINDWEVLIREDPFQAINPMNLGRNILQTDFPCPVLVWLNDEAMGQLFNSAPDFTSWRSGSFQFDSSEADAERFAQEVKEAPGRLSRLRLRWMRWVQPNDLADRIHRVEKLIQDAVAAELPSSDVARLRGELGFLYLVARDGRAQDEFLQMQNAGVDPAGARWGLNQARQIPRPPAEAIGRDLALDFSDVLLGREQELANLVARARQPGNRFLVLWGDSGCGKSALARVGLIPALQEQGVRTVLIEGDYESLDCDLPGLLAPAREGKETVVVLDQFERVFQTLGDGERRKLFSKIREAYADVRLPCRFLLLVRTDYLGRLAEFDNVDLPDVLRKDWRIHLPFLESPAALKIMRGLREKVQADWPEPMLEQLCQDLREKYGRTKPVEVRLAVSAMLARNIQSLDDYLKDGKLRGLMDGFVDFSLSNLGVRFADYDAWKRVLLALLDEETGARLRLTAEEVVRRLGLGEGSKVARLGWNPLKCREEVEGRLAKLRDAGLISDVARGERFEIPHDALAELILDSTRTLRDRKRLAGIVLRNGVEAGKRWLSGSELDLAEGFPEAWAFDEERARLCSNSLKAAGLVQWGKRSTLFAIAFGVVAWLVLWAYPTYREARLEHIGNVGNYPVSKLSAAARVHLFERGKITEDGLLPERMSSRAFGALARSLVHTTCRPISNCNAIRAVAASWISDRATADALVTSDLFIDTYVIRTIKSKVTGRAVEMVARRFLAREGINDRDGMVLAECWSNLDVETRKKVLSKIAPVPFNGEWPGLLSRGHSPDPWFIQLKVAADSDVELGRVESVRYLRAVDAEFQRPFVGEMVRAWGDKLPPNLKQELIKAACDANPLSWETCSGADALIKLKDDEAINRFRQNNALFKFGLYGSCTWSQEDVWLIRRDLIRDLVKGVTEDPTCGRWTWLASAPELFERAVGVRISNPRELIEWAEREGPTFKCSDGRNCSFDITRPFPRPNEDQSTTVLYFLDRLLL